MVVTVRRPAFSAPYWLALEWGNSLPLSVRELVHTRSTLQRGVPKLEYLVFLIKQNAPLSQELESHLPTRFAQAFNKFYHRFHILSEPDTDRQQFILYQVYLVNEVLAAALGLMGIEIPERM